MIELMLTPRQKKILKANPEYYLARNLDGQLCALRAYMTTVGLCINIDEMQLERRYCFQDAVGAVESILAMTSVNGHVTGNWIKVKGEFEGRPIDEFNPNWIKAT